MPTMPYTTYSLRVRAYARVRINMPHFLHLKDSLRYTSYTHAHFQMVAISKNHIYYKKS